MQLNATYRFEHIEALYKIHMNAAEITHGTTCKTDVAFAHSSMHPLRVNKMSCRLQGLFEQTSVPYKHCNYLNGGWL
jgi:hypothetical protein